MISKILSESSISVSALKKNPMAVVNSGGGEPVAVLNHNQPAFYCVPADTYAALLDELDDMRLAMLVQERESNPQRELVKVDLNDL